MGHSTGQTVCEMPEFIRRADRVMKDKEKADHIGLYIIITTCETRYICLQFLARMSTPTFLMPVRTA
jgi:hypothetical protein